MGANREYKNSVFSLLFGNPEAIRGLYGAIAGVELPPDIPVTINTLEDALFKTKINDISAEIGGIQLLLIEHQSSINPNMPARLLSYTARVYEKILTGKKNAKLYGKKGVTLPRPEFIVLYNGEEPFPDRAELKLSESFADPSVLGLPAGAPPGLELIARVYNINEGRNREITQRNETLSGYASFIARTREFEAELSGDRKRGAISKEERANIKKAAMERAVKWCVGHGILQEFLSLHGTEVMNMLFDEWNLEEALVVEREEGREEGWEKGREEIVRNALAKGFSMETIREITGFDIDAIQSLAGEM
jgi:hypothetical protein